VASYFTAVGHISSGSFDHIADRIRGRIQGCDNILSRAGREVFLKTVIQAIPIHSISCFRLTKKVRKNLRSCIAKY
jgi:hypothetical protein